MCVLGEIPVITFSLWCARLLASLVCRYGQKVTVIKNGSVICLGKVVNNHFVNSSSPSCSGSSRVSH